MKDFFYFFRFVSYFLTGILVGILLFWDDDYNLQPFNYIIVLLWDIIILLHSRKNIFFFIVFGIILYCNYSIIYPNYIHHIDNFFTGVISLEVTNKSLNILTLFNVLIGALLPIRIYPTPIGRRFLSSDKSLTPIAIKIVSIILILIFIYGYKSPSTIGVRVDPSPVYEYSVAIFIVVLYFTKTRRERLFFGILCVLFAGQNFIFGGRVTGLQYLLCCYLFLFSHRITPTKLCIFALPLLFIMVLIGSVRGALLSGDFSLYGVLNHIIDSGGALDTAYSAYYTSEIFVYADARVSNHIEYLVVLIIAVFIGYGPFPGMLLQNVADRFMTNYAGGILPYYFYFFLGWVGVIISAFIVRVYLNCVTLIHSNGNGLIKCIAAFFICHTFRWYLYTPYSLLRGTLFITLVYCVVNLFFTKQVKQRKQIIGNITHA